MPRHPPCALRSLSHKYSTKTTLVIVEVVQELILLLQRPVARAAGEPADLLRATENATSDGDGCREDARVHYEGINVQARRIDLDARAPGRTRGGAENQLPDLSKLNSVPGPRASGPAAGSTPGLRERRRGSTEQTVLWTEVIHRRFH